jgi:hypothetical protein
MWRDAFVSLPSARLSSALESSARKAPTLPLVTSTRERACARLQRHTCGRIFIAFARFEQWLPARRAHRTSEIHSFGFCCPAAPHPVWPIPPNGRSPADPGWRDLGPEAFGLAHTFARTPACRLSVHPPYAASLNHMLYNYLCCTI